MVVGTLPLLLVDDAGEQERGMPEVLIGEDVARANTFFEAVLHAGFEGDDEGESIGTVSITLGVVVVELDNDDSEEQGDDASKRQSCSYIEVFNASLSI